ncbi:sensor histidine kinase [Planomonospora venezuelensis]|uniref:histidine kinase n=1 Tax=Planomonospora venezuelensis TaxID=1999 RepID=A0A841D2V2_PLAVE|nr:signal transduction histidine kinase [Planomonospora venezuelensis]GIM99134.1 two-component sensor histidine kinase [Planomonospora venezuelensis]
MLALLRSVWDESRPPRPPLRVWRDWALAGVLVPAAVLEGVLRPDLPWRTLSVFLAVALVPTLLWRRTRPLPMLAVCFTATGLVPMLLGAPPSEMYTMVYQLILVYSLFRWGSGREAVIGLVIMLVALPLSVLSGRTPGADAVGALTFMFSTITLGAAFRYRARARMRELDQVKLLEREQLARDLHDTVAHHVSAMAIRAQAGLATSASRPDAAAEALRVIEAEAARALTEMRAMVRVLRQDRPADLAPGRRIADLEHLAGRSRSGPSVDVEISGDLDGLPPPVEAAIYRLAQESVTNARRHARHATLIEVRVTSDDTSVHLCVSDDGDTGAMRPAASPGYGIIGMIERAGLLGGSCEAGPNPGRGWTVTAVLPRTGAAT